VLIGGLIHDLLCIRMAAPASCDVVTAARLGWSLVFVAAVFSVMHLGVQLSGRVQLAVAGLGGVVLAFTVSVIVSSDDNSLKAFNQAGRRRLDGYRIRRDTALIFVSFESAANSEETTEPGNVRARCCSRS
jgi:amino acid transporter